MLRARSLLLLLSGAFLYQPLWAQKAASTVDAFVQPAQVKSHIEFLAADELRGRATGTPENAIAARYLAEQYQAMGLLTPPGLDDYLQPVALLKRVPPTSATLTLGREAFQLNQDLIFTSARAGQYAGPVLFVGYGMPEDLAGKDVKGKILVAQAGTADPKQPFYHITAQKKEAASQAGARALIEVYTPQAIPWAGLLSYFGHTAFTPVPENAAQPLPAAWLLDDDGSLLDRLRAATDLTGSLTLAGAYEGEVTVPNVVGWIKGSDPALRDQYLVLSAHFDHIGVQAASDGGDSIYNGARDNALGVTAMLSTAAYFAKHPPKRSVVFLACNAEEVGLLGSAWYAAHPLFPLKQTVFDLNSDGAGYNDTSKVTIIGFNRTSVTDLLTQSAAAYGLEAIDDPVPAQNLYDRSDNVSFAAQGVPSVNYAPGTTAFDEALMKYYHQAADEPASLDYDYVVKFTKAFVLTAEQIANQTKKPSWTKGDKYEAAGKALYGK
ncbi:Peptidase family M28 [Catalinimonas alkaloidigena]|uniref:Peptidase family M28 n=1 Tax=Catalinimonas alkaloidigena TaxID=1075417 RepID=A0A1G9RLJ2_9BACT|nr:M28 family peptidase [Catalinimonas alkaloidigena]SDM23920.1 Peptidase family M28 [Catalinimonas alkaloidigena]